MQKAEAVRGAQAILLVTILSVLPMQSGFANATSYRLDPKETMSSFELWVFGLIPVRGHFKRTTGTMSFDAASKVGNIEVLIDTTSVEASSARAEAAARGADFFDVEKYPRMEFKSSRFVFEDGRLHSVEGVLTLKAKTQPVTLIVQNANCKVATAMDAASCRAEATLSVKRSDFGMKAWSHSIGDHVTIRIAIVAVADAGETNAKAAMPVSPGGSIEAPTLPSRAP
ncbi:MAG: YceI family protein [Burkholderiales bacterium]|nr:YceI family protein [Burkholderiales bacterium]